MDDVKSILTFHKFWVESLYFKHNSIYKPNQRPSLECKFHVSHNYDKDDDNKLLLSIKCELFQEDFTEEDNPFYLSLNVNGLFSVEDDGIGDDLSKSKILKANSVAILFPYIRSIVSNITLTANVPPVILPPINTYQLMENVAKQVTPS